MRYHISKSLLLAIIHFILPATVVMAQMPTQTVKGIVTDRERGTALPGANIIILNSSPLTGTITDEKGKFHLSAPIGRITIKASYMGYQDMIIRDILVATGKQVDLPVEMTENVVNANEVIITAGANNTSSLNQMATISARTLRANDALRFAGGFYDPSRMVNSFAGVVTANSDESNDIVIRGNSSRGLLWRLEGIEIPNPNHFSDGQGGSGGAYSAITSNVISSLDFFTGAFPAEYGNAMSGVMDLTLRKGNTDKHEFAFQTGMIGAELAAEGPLSKSKNSSFLINARYVNFGLLSNLGLIDLGETNYAPRSHDMVFNINISANKSGTFNVFGFTGSSSLGKTAEHNYNSWEDQNDSWEEMEEISSAVVGIKHFYPLPGGNSYMRSVAAFTTYHDSYSEGFIDSSYNRTNSYYYDFRYPAIRFSEMLNSRITARTILRTGVNAQYLMARMQDMKLNLSGTYDTLVAPEASGLLLEYYAQIKNRVTENFDITYGFHTMSYSVNREMTVEPRAGIRWQASPGNFFNAGVGIHSRMESFPVYYNLIKNDFSEMVPLNSDLRFSKSFHTVAGVDLSVAKNIRFKIELYNQNLFDIPIVDNKSSRYSSINSAEDLPSAKLENKGLGFNRGIEFTLEKSYSSNYYFLFTLSLFDSKYRAGDTKWYNTYYNTSFVSNLLAGKDFYFGSTKRNCIGLNLKSLFRGGYRYTPVDVERTTRYKRIIYSTDTYGKRLPDFLRVDGGISYRRNNPGFSWIIMADVQNLTGRKNIFRKKFSYSNGAIVESNVYSLGAVPVLNFRIEF
jgi:hypothetical protein